MNLQNMRPTLKNYIWISSINLQENTSEIMNPENITGTSPIIKNISYRKKAVKLTRYMKSWATRSEKSSTSTTETHKEYVNLVSTQQPKGASPDVMWKTDV